MIFFLCFPFGLGFKTLNSPVVRTRDCSSAQAQQFLNTNNEAIQSPLAIKIVVCIVINSQFQIVVKFQTHAINIFLRKS